MAIGNPSSPRVPVAAALALLCVAGLAGCKASPTAGRHGASADAPPPAVVVPAAPTPAAPVPAAAAPVARDELGLPAIPPGAKTSDPGDRLARPTPVGQLAPEDAPPTGPGK